MYKRSADRSLTDARFWLYSRAPISTRSSAPPPRPTGRAAATAHLRWHPLRGEWVAYAEPPAGPHVSAARRIQPAGADAPIRTHPTELPVGDYDVAVFENLFPTLSTDAHGAAASTIVDTRPRNGACEVVVFTQDPAQSLGSLPLVAHRAALRGLGRPVRRARRARRRAVRVSRSRTAASRSA